jgi:rhodanese-related sulfurtransferase
MIKSMNVSELKEKLDNRPGDVLVVDCREQGEWDAGHIEGAILIPLSEFAPKHGEILKDKSKTIVMQCRSGRRSLTACQLLLAEGFEDLYNLEGGILDWEAHDYEIVKD